MTKKSPKARSASRPGARRKSPKAAVKSKNTDIEYSPGDTKSKIRSKLGLPPGFRGIVREGSSVMLISVDTKGHEKVISCYIKE